MLTVLDYLGTFAFGLSGGMVAVERKMDIVGILILSTLTGIGGGILRDVILGSTPPVAFLSHHYFLLLILSGFLVFFFYRRVKSFERLVVVVDALGLGVFTLIGMEKGLAYRLPFLNVILGHYDYLRRSVKRCAGQPGAFYFEAGNLRQCLFCRGSFVSSDPGCFSPVGELCAGCFIYYYFSSYCLF